RPGPSHVQPGEIRTAVSIACDNLTIEHGRFGWELVQQLGDGRKPLREIMPIATVDDHPRAYLVGLHAVAVELHLVQPTVAGRHFLGSDWAAGRYEAERGHASGCSCIAPNGQLMRRAAATLLTPRTFSGRQGRGVLTMPTRARSAFDTALSGA